MAERATVERAGHEIMAAVSAEFPDVSLTLDFETPRDDYEDAYLWLTSPDADPEHLNEVWAYTIKLVQAAYDTEDVYLVARVRGAIIIRDREGDYG